MGSMFDALLFLILFLLLSWEAWIAQSAQNIAVLTVCALLMLYGVIANFRDWLKDKKAKQ